MSEATTQIPSARYWMYVLHLLFNAIFRTTDDFHVLLVLQHIRNKVVTVSEAVVIINKSKFQRNVKKM